MFPTPNLRLIERVQRTRDRVRAIHVNYHYAKNAIIKRDQAGSQPVLDTCSSRYPFELASQYKTERQIYMYICVLYRLRREATPSGGGCCRVAATAACHVSQRAIIITNDQMSIFRGNICFLHSLSSTSNPPHLPTPSFPLPIERYRSVLSLNK